MRYTTLFIAVLACAASMFSTVTATPLEFVERAPGPSGAVIRPAGGTNFNTGNLWPTLKMRFTYSTVNVLKNPCNTFWCSAETWSVAVTLRNEAGGNVISLASYLTPPAPGQNIDVWLTAPQGTCGTYRLIVREYQNYYGDFIEFQSAAPLITITCMGPI